MKWRVASSAVSVVVAGILVACSSSFDRAPERAGLVQPFAATDAATASVYRADPVDRGEMPPTLGPGSLPDDFVRHALYYSPEVEAAYQRWRAAAERVPQAGALPDPRLPFGFFLGAINSLLLDFYLAH